MQPFKWFNGGHERRVDWRNWLEDERTAEEFFRLLYSPYHYSLADLAEFASHLSPEAGELMDECRDAVASMLDLDEGSEGPHMLLRWFRSDFRRFRAWWGHAKQHHEPRWPLHDRYMTALGCLYVDESSHHADDISRTIKDLATAGWDEHSEVLLVISKTLRGEVHVPESRFPLGYRNILPKIAEMRDVLMTPFSSSDTLNYFRAAVEHLGDRLDYMGILYAGVFVQKDRIAGSVLDVGGSDHLTNKDYTLTNMWEDTILSLERCPRHVQAMCAAYMLRDIHRDTSTTNHGGLGRSKTDGHGARICDLCVDLIKNHLASPHMDRMFEGAQFLLAHNIYMCVLEGDDTIYGVSDDLSVAMWILTRNIRDCGLHSPAVYLYNIANRVNCGRDIELWDASTVKRDGTMFCVDECMADVDPYVARNLWWSNMLVLMKEKLDRREALGKCHWVSWLQLRRFMDDMERYRHSVVPLDDMSGEDDTGFAYIHSFIHEFHTQAVMGDRQLFHVLTGEVVDSVHSRVVLLPRNDDVMLSVEDAGVAGVDVYDHVPECVEVLVEMAKKVWVISQTEIVLVGVNQTWTTRTIINKLSDALTHLRLHEVEVEFGEIRRGVVRCRIQDESSLPLFNIIVVETMPEDIRHGILVMHDEVLITTGMVRMIWEEHVPVACFPMVVSATVHWDMDRPNVTGDSRLNLMMESFPELIEPPVLLHSATNSSKCVGFEKALGIREVLSYVCSFLPSEDVGCMSLAMANLRTHHDPDNITRREDKEPTPAVSLALLWNGSWAMPRSAPTLDDLEVMSFSPRGVRFTRVGREWMWKDRDMLVRLIPSSARREMGGDVLVVYPYDKEHSFVASADMKTRLRFVWPASVDWGDVRIKDIIFVGGKMHVLATRHQGTRLLDMDGQVVFSSPRNYEFADHTGDRTGIVIANDYLSIVIAQEINGKWAQRSRVSYRCCRQRTMLHHPDGSYTRIFIEDGVLYIKQQGQRPSTLPTVGIQHIPREVYVCHGKMWVLCRTGERHSYVLYEGEMH